MRIKCRGTGELVFSYTDYLQTQHWRDLRARAYEKSAGICKCCARPLDDGFVCHHRSTGAYRRVGRERIDRKFWRDDVVAVCHDCHDGQSKNHVKLHEFINVPLWARQET